MSIGVLPYSTLAPSGLGYFLWSEIRERRRSRGDDNDAQDGPREGPAGRSGDDAVFDASGHLVGVDAATGEVSHDRLMARTVRDRYGTRFEAERQRSLRGRNRLDF